MEASYGGNELGRKIFSIQFIFILYIYIYKNLTQIGSNQCAFCRKKEYNIKTVLLINLKYCKSIQYTKKSVGMNYFHLDTEAKEKRCVFSGLIWN